MPDAYRIETDLLGSVEIPGDRLYGIHTARAVQNFPLAKRPVSRHLVHAYGQVKLACAQTNHELGYLDDPLYGALETACHDLVEGRLDEHLVVDALQGGAGTSTNMNVNEVLANRGLQLLNRSPGDYETLHPIDHVNLHQSTNDTYPTALRVAAIHQLRRLERDVVGLVDAFQHKEREFASIVKIGRTQLQDAVLTTLGRSMGAFAEAFARDRWRIYKCEERLRVVNLGGTAIGTGLGAPRQYIFRVVDHLREITGQGLARAENLIDATQNTDPLVEVSGILRTLASNLQKVAGDLRWLSSGPDGGLGEIRLPPLQAGSSIMPGKINPVIPEAVGQAALAIAAQDQTVMQACSLGNLELNQFMPLIADSLLGMIDLAGNACRILTTACVEGIEPRADSCRRGVDTATATLTALVDRIGYAAAQEIAEASEREHKSIREIVLQRRLMSEADYDQAISADAVTRLGSLVPPPPKRADSSKPP
jgi:aspartate ammonia-lyase